MSFLIRKMIKDDKSEIISMMTEFYASDVVSTNGSLEIFEKDFLQCIEENSCLLGFTFLYDETIVGYAMVAKSFSTEFAKQCLMLEDLYLKKDYRGKGFISKFFEKIEKEFTNSLLKLEVEAENESAVNAYLKNGFKSLPYSEMIKKI